MRLSTTATTLLADVLGERCILFGTLQEVDRAVKSKNAHWGSTLNDFLKEEGIHEQATTSGIKSVIGMQLSREMKKKPPSELVRALGAAPKN